MDSQKRIALLAGSALFMICAAASAQTPEINPEAVVNAADGSQRIAPGSIVSISGRDIASATNSATRPPLPTLLGGASLELDGVALPLFNVSPTGITAQIPWELLGQSESTLTYSVNGIPGPAIRVKLTTYAPAIFSVTGQGDQGIIMHDGGRALAAPLDKFEGSRPAHAGDFVWIRCTGLGPVRESPPSGETSLDVHQLNKTSQQPRVTIGGVDALVANSGLAPGLVGTYDVKVRIPSNAPEGEAVPVSLTINGEGSNTVTMAIERNPDAVEVSITPSTATVQSWSTLKFTATVSNAADQSVTWGLVKNDRSSINSGVLATGEAGYDDIIVTATSVADPGKYASARVTVVPAPNEITVRIAPPNPYVIFGQQIQFTAQVQNAQDAKVTWRVDNNGSISPDGLFTAPAPDLSFLYSFRRITITATAATPYTSAVAQTNVFLAPLVPRLREVVPPRAAAGEEIRVYGENLFGDSLVYFQGENNTRLLARGTPEAGYQSVRVPVPNGARSGSVCVEFAPVPDEVLYRPPYRTNCVPFVRQPALRIRAAKRDLAAGESTELQARLLGADGSVPLVWTAELGAVSQEGTFTAPQTVASDSFTRVTGCIRDTRECDTVRIGLHPFRIEPFQPVVAAGKHIQLSAISGNSTVSARWSLLSGVGALTPEGLYTASAAAGDGGGVEILATYNGATQKVRVAVSGLTPGLINRVSDYIDGHDKLGPGTHMSNLAVSGTRAYVLSVRGRLLPKPPYWFDVYDISDPVRPVWKDAVETGMETALDVQLYATDRTLFAIAPQYFDTTNGYLAKTVATAYDISSGRPRLTDRAVLPFFKTATAFVWLHDGEPAGLDYEGTSFFRLRFADGKFTQEMVKLPPAIVSPSCFPTSAIGAGNRVYVAYQCAIPGVPVIISTLDLSTSPPSWLGNVESDAPILVSRHRISGNLLFAGKHIFDISGTLPVELSSWPDSVSIGPAGGSGAQVALQSMSPLLLTGDASTPQYPRTLSSQFWTEPLFGQIGLGDWAALPSPHIGAWAAGYFLTAELPGGLGVYDLTQGGPIPRNNVLVYSSCSTQALISGTRLYSAEFTLADKLAAYDLTSEKPALLGFYSEMPYVMDALEVKDDIVFVAMYTERLAATTAYLAMLDFSDPANPVKIGSIDMPANYLKRVGDVLFVAARDGTLGLLDITQPREPKLIDKIPLPSPAVRLRSEGTLLFVSAAESGLLIFDIADPRKPRLTAQFRDVKLVLDSAVEGKLAFLAAGDRGLAIVDVSDVTRPRLISQTALENGGNQPTIATTVLVKDGIAYTGGEHEWDTCLHGLDYRRPESPREVVFTCGRGHGEGPFFLSSLLPYQKSLFVSGCGWGLMDLDVSNPRNLVLFAPPERTLRPSAPKMPNSIRVVRRGTGQQRFQPVAPPYQTIAPPVTRQ